MFLASLFLALSAVMAWAIAITLPAVALGRIIAAALVRLIKGKKK
jgi:hypothetical protein